MTIQTKPPDDLDRTHLSDADLFALELALKLMLNDPEWRDTVADKLRTDGWYEAAAFASFSQQCDRLRLQPWQAAPRNLVGHDLDAIIAANDDSRSELKAAKLLKKMQQYGISPFHPDVIAALAVAQQRAR